MKTLIALIVALVIGGGADVFGQYRTVILDHSTSPLDSSYEVPSYQQMQMTMRYLCFACSGVHKLEFIECECPIDKSYPPECGNRHFAMFCTRTGIYFVLKDLTENSKHLKGKLLARSIHAVEISGTAVEGVLDYATVRELPPITDWKAFDYNHNLSDEVCDALWEQAWSCRFIPR
jgi:hypothetical protein